MAKRVLLVRHAALGPEYGGRYNGSTDAVIGPDGYHQAARLAAVVKKFAPAACFCSPLKRARQTAVLITRDLGLECRPDLDLREIDFGRWEGLKFEEIAAAEPAAVKKWAALGPDFRFPDGEAFGAFAARVQAAAKRLTAGPGGNLLAVTHGGVIRLMICYLLGLPARHYLLFDVQPASLAVLDIFDGRGVLTALNIV